jgi:hypothetical protein
MNINKKIFEEFLKNKNMMRIAYYAMIALAILYTLVSFFLGQVHATPSPDPYLRVPNENYYYWATIWYGISILAGWILAAACMQLLARATGGKGDCPLKYLQLKIGDQTPFFNIFLPKKLAQSAVPFFTIITFLGITILIVRLLF